MRKPTTALVLAGMCVVATACGTGSTADNATSTSTTAAPMPVPAAGELRGYFAPRAFWDDTYPAAQPADCAARAGRGIDYTRGWQLPGGVLACARFETSSGRIDDVDLYFDPAVDAQAATAAAFNVLPTDSTHVGSVPGVNWPAPLSGPEATGSCHVERYTSEALAAARTAAVVPSFQWPAPPEQFTVVLFSGMSFPDTADRPFDPESVHVASITMAVGDRTTTEGVAC
jgi:hypothetical protein